MGSCQNCGPCLGTPNNRCRIIIGTQKGTRILTTTQIDWGLGFVALGLEAEGGLQGLGVQIQGSWGRVQRSGFRVGASGLGFRV